MPGRDRQGPEGNGPMTGRAMGRCAGYGAAGNGRQAAGRLNRRRSAMQRFPGGRRGYWSGGRPTREFYDEAPLVDGEKQALESQVAVLQQQLQDIQKKLKEIER